MMMIRRGVFGHPSENSDRLRELREKLRQDSRDSFRLLENLWDNPVCSIIHDEANHCIVVVWKQYATQIQLRYIHESLLTLICKHHVWKILGDDTALPTIARKTGSGLSTSGFHGLWSAACALPPVKGLPPNFGKLAVSHIQSAAPAGIECRSFEQLDEATEWLDTARAG